MRVSKPLLLVQKRPRNFPTFLLKDPIGGIRTLVQKTESLSKGRVEKTRPYFTHKRMNDHE